MHDQPRLNPLRRSDFFADQRGSRPLVAGTVARGQLRDDPYFYKGVTGKDQPGDVIPLPITADFLRRGQERFNIYCTPCHSRTGDGNGMIVQRGLRHPPSFHSDAIRQRNVAHYFDVMTNGFGAMLDYSQQISVEDRWAIAAYIRVLQYSQHAPLSDVPEELRGSIAGSPSAAAPPPEKKP